jgi:hypothetical protein
MLSFTSTKDGATKQFESLKSLFVDAEGKEVDRGVRFDLFGEYLGTSKFLEKPNWVAELDKKLTEYVAQYGTQLENLKKLKAVCESELAQLEAQKLEDTLGGMTNEQLTALREKVEAEEKRRGNNA